MATRQAPSMPRRCSASFSWSSRRLTPPLQSVRRASTVSPWAKTRSATKGLGSPAQLHARLPLAGTSTHLASLLLWRHGTNQPPLARYCIGTPRPAQLHNPHPSPPQSRLCIDGFTNFLLATTSVVSAGEAEESKLEQPLNRYYIATSHNTWLVESQTVGKVSADQYSTVLRDGCRCVESKCSAII